MAGPHAYPDAGREGRCERHPDRRTSVSAGALWKWAAQGWGGSALLVWPGSRAPLVRSGSPASSCPGRCELTPERCSR
jgi:hypothetical protein